MQRTASSGQDGVTEAAKDTQDQEVKEEDEEGTSEEARTIDGVGEVTDSSPGVHPTEGTDPTYFTLIPAEENNTEEEDSGNEVAAVIPEDGAASSSTEVLTQKGDNSTHVPLIPSTDHGSPNEQSNGYEVAGVMQSATNANGEAESSFCSRPSQKTTGPGQTTSYDHLARDSSKLSHDGALSGKNQNDDYQHLQM